MLRESTGIGLRPEDIAASTPLALAPLDELREVSRASPLFLGWTRFYIGLRSAPRQLAHGRWQAQENFAWLDGDWERAAVMFAG